MNKAQFLSAVRERLAGLPQGDLERAIEYYGEMIDDRMEDGLSEEAAVAVIGSVEDVCSQILAEMPLPRLVCEKVRPARALRVWEIILLVLGSPVWVPLLLAAAVVMLAVYVVIWTLVVCLYAVDLSLAAAALSGLAGTAFAVWQWTAAHAMLMLGAGLVCAGLCILLFLGCNQTALAIGRISRAFVLWVKARFLKRRD